MDIARGVSKDGCQYVNAARVPRVVRDGPVSSHHHVRVEINGETVTPDRWNDTSTIHNRNVYDYLCGALSHLAGNSRRVPIALYYDTGASGGANIVSPCVDSGSYLVREFSKNIVRIWATSGGDSVPLERVDKHTWIARGCADELTVEMEVYAWDLWCVPRIGSDPWIFQRHIHVFEVHGMEQERCTVELSPPQRTMVHSGGLPRDATCVNLWNGLFEAEDYDALIDHPVEMGTFEVREFRGPRHATRVCLDRQIHLRLGPFD